MAIRSRCIFCGEVGKEREREGGREREGERGRERERERGLRFEVLLSSAYKPTRQGGTKHDQLSITHSDM